MAEIMCHTLASVWRVLLVLATLISCTLAVMGEPQLLDRSTSTVIAKVGETVRLKCIFFVWKDKWEMIWKVDGKKIQITQEKRFRQRDGKSSLLRIKLVQNNDSGMYECVASNDYGTVSRKLNLTVVGERKPLGQPGKGPPWFTKVMPKTQFIAWPASSDMKMRCPADGEPPLKYQWLKNGKVLKYRRLGPKFNATRWYLRIKTAVPSDNGLYKCVVSNRLGNISHDIQLVVIEKGPVRPVLSVKFPVNKTARIGENITFQCIELFSPILTDYRWLHWKKLPPNYPDLGFDSDSQSLNSSYYEVINPRHYEAFEVQISEGKYGGRVLLTNITKEDEGMYTCLVNNHVGKAWRSAFLKIVTSDGPTDRPKFVPQSYLTEVGKTVNLKCAFTNWHVCWNMTWYMHGEVIHPRMNVRFRIVIGKSSSLVIKDVQKEDSGIFECVASNAFGSVNKKFNLSVVGSSPSIKEKNPRFKNTFKNSERMACSISTVRKSLVKRRQNGKNTTDLLAGDPHPTTSHQFTITLKSVKPEDAGTHTCNVSDHHDSINFPYEINEIERSGPMLEDFRDVEAEEGENVTLTCRAYNRNKPKLIWFAFDNAMKQYKMMRQGTRVQLEAVENKEGSWQGERLRLLNVTPGDSKKYLCLGINLILSRSQSVSVTVISRKKIKKC